MVSGLGLALLIATGRLDEWFSEPSARRIRGIRWVVTLALVLVSTWTGLYYAAFTVLFAFASLIWRWAHGGTPRTMKSSILVSALTVASAVLGLIPVLLSRATAPGLADLALRTPMESVQYAGNLLVTLLPEPYSQISSAYNDTVLGMFADTVQAEPVLMANFGTWVTALAVVTWLVGLATSSRSRARIDHEPRRVSLTLTVYLFAVALLFFIPWGLNYLFATFATAQLRGWNRLAPYLLLLVILGAAAALHSWRWPRKRSVAVVLTVALLLITFLEAVLPWRRLYSEVPAAGAERLSMARTYSLLSEGALPGNCAVLTLPNVPFLNQGPRVGMDDYDHFLLWLVNPRRPISYGAYEGSATWEHVSQFGENLTASQVDELRSMGFCAVHVDSAGYEDPTSVLSSLQGVLGPPVASVGRWTMFKL